MTEIDSRTLAGSSSFRCERCSYLLELADVREGLPECPQCGAQAWARAPLFTTPGATAKQPAAASEPATEWIAQTRAQLEQAGAYIAYEDAGRTVIQALAPDSMRIGRSMSATVRFDDPTVSRRHALIVYGEGGAARLLDDRSLNGVFVNGSRVQECELSDGDEIMIGRYRLHYLVCASTPAQTARA